MTVSEIRGRVPLVTWAGLLALGAVHGRGDGLRRLRDARPARRHELAARRAGSPPIRVSTVGGLVEARSRASEPIMLEWLSLAPGEDIERVTRRRSPPDVLLGSLVIVVRATLTTRAAAAGRSPRIRLAGASTRRAAARFGGAGRSSPGYALAGVGHDASSSRVDGGRATPGWSTSPGIEPRIGWRAGRGTRMRRPRSDLLTCRRSPAGLKARGS